MHHKIFKITWSLEIEISLDRSSCIMKWVMRLITLLRLISQCNAESSWELTKIFFFRKFFVASFECWYHEVDYSKLDIVRLWNNRKCLKAISVFWNKHKDVKPRQNRYKVLANEGPIRTRTRLTRAPERTIWWLRKMGEWQKRAETYRTKWIHYEKWSIFGGDSCVTFLILNDTTIRQFSWINRFNLSK